MPTTRRRLLSGSPCIGQFLRRLTPAVLVLSATTLSGPFASSPAPQGGPTAPPRLRARLAEVDLSRALPADLAAPEGKSRWNLKGLTLGERWVRDVAGAGEAVVVDDAGTPAPRGAGGARRLLYRDAPDAAATGLGTSTGMATRYARPDRAGGAALRPGHRERLVVDQVEDRGTTRVLIDRAVVGIGRVELPPGPHEVVLERLLVQRRTAGGGYTPDRVVHRWVDPRNGVVAEVSGRATADGRDRSFVDAAFVLDTVIEGAVDTRIYANDLYGPVLTDLGYSRDRGAGTTIASLTPTPGIVTAGDLIALSTWDFSANTTGAEVAFTTVTPSAAETCNFAQCGYTLPGVQLERTDRNFDMPASLRKVNDIVEYQERANDTVIWLRAGSQFEGSTASPPNAENRFCYTTVGTTTRTPVPLWVMSHQDLPGQPRYVTTGDAWTSTAFNCEQNVFNNVCGQSQALDTLYIKGCTAPNTGTHTGTQFGSAIKGGVVTLPSGHTFNALLVRNVADFCIFLGASCGSLGRVSEARTVNYLWQVPNVGTVMRIQSPQNAPVDLVSFTTADAAEVSFGLFPPRSISVTAQNDTTVSLSWDPGLDTHRLSGYKIYWDTDSGAATPYAFNSDANPAQAAIAGTTAVISGLLPGTTYHFTVTSLSNYTDPSSAVVTRYESILYPTQVSGDPAFIYPIEVQATTTGGSCIPSAEVTGLTVAHDPGGIQICWNPVADPCLTGYQVLGAATPEAAANFSVVADPGVATCWIGNPASTYFLVVAKGTGGNGPWGHYGQ
ncbi:MAG TPA: fibronectin type III domain-containing protein [Dongiaceae bacterium]|nr:fibronectin type III domain-containing protein [Dongiaceae bacterium]